jgi:hypothetical protein
MMRSFTLAALLVLAVPGLGGAWEEPPPPPDLKTVDGTGTFWPYTGQDYSGETTDPINLVFVGDADPRLIRQALMQLDGNRSAVPQLALFDCTWRDAIGRPQTNYSVESGWEGSAIQLECGEYSTLRAHIRLFRHGPYTLAGAHLEVQIPGTTRHEVLSWIAPRDLVAFDMSRTGLLAAPPAPVGGLTQVPTYREIQYQVLNGVPDGLRVALGLPPGELHANVPIPNDGMATVLTLSGQLEKGASEALVEFDHPFDQGIPRPFCATSPTDGLYVKGPVHIVHRSWTDEYGRYGSSVTASGVLQVVPIDLATQQPTGTPYLATVYEAYRSRLTDHRQAAAMVAAQALFSDPPQSLVEKLWAGLLKGYASRESCGN